MALCGSCHLSSQPAFNAHKSRRWKGSSWVTECAPFPLGGNHGTPLARRDQGCGNKGCRSGSQGGHPRKGGIAAVLWMNVFLWQELLRYSFGSYYELLSSKIMKGLSFFFYVSDMGETARKTLLAVFKRCWKNLRDFRKKAQGKKIKTFYLHDWKAGSVKRRKKGICLLKNVLKHFFWEEFRNSCFGRQQTRDLVIKDVRIREEEKLKPTNS